MLKSNILPKKTKIISIVILIIFITYICVSRFLLIKSYAAQTTESFIQFFATATFRCTKLEYHERTNFVKSLYFEQI